MEKIVLTLSSTATDYHVDVLKKVAGDLKEQYKCNVIVRNIDGVVLYEEVYDVEEEKRRELADGQIPIAF